METRILSIFLIVAYLNVIAYSKLGDCPKLCTCKITPQRDNSRWLKLRCGDSERISHSDDLDLINISNEILQLNLSFNYLTEYLPKTHFAALQKLDLSHNKLTALFNNQFSEMPNLKRLDISSNGLKRIEYAAFFSLKHLERLRLSQNHLSSFSAGTFEPLKNLKHLDISDNPLTCDCALMNVLQWMDKKSVKMLNNPTCKTPEALKGTFIRKIQMGIDLSCPHITLPHNTTQHTPVTKPPNALSIQLQQSTNSNTNHQLDTVTQSQQLHVAILEGDEFTLHCKAVYHQPSADYNVSGNDGYEDSSEAALQWTWLDSDPTKVFADVSVEEDALVKGVGSMVRVGRVRKAHAGVWKCAVVGSGGGAEAHTRLLVMGACPAITLQTRGKGIYQFPPTPPSTTAQQPCTVQTTPAATGTPSTVAMATLYCNATGHWRTSESLRNFTSAVATIPDLTACGWLSERTRVLQQFAQLQLQLQDRRTLVDSLRHFDNYTKQILRRSEYADVGSEIMDLVFSVRTIDNFANELRVKTEHLAGPLLDIINGLLELPDDLLATAQLEDNSCGKLLDVLRKITTVAPSSVLHKSNVAMEAFSVKPESFAGLTCSWWQQQDGAGNNGRMFHCTAAPSLHSGHGNHSNSSSAAAANINSNNRQLLASIQVPPSLFHQLYQFGLLPRSSSKSGNAGSNNSINIVMATERIRVEMFGGGGLFPVTVDSSSMGGNTSSLREEITSTVVGFAIDNMTVDALTEPIYLILSTPPSPHCVTSPRPVWYDPVAHSWSIQGCHALRHHRDSTALVFQCRQFGVYALQQTCNAANGKMGGGSGGRVMDGGDVGAGDRAIGWVVGGSIVLWVGLVMGVYGVWMSGRRRRRTVPVRARHALVNTWLAIAALTALYTAVVVIGDGHSSDGGRLCTTLSVLMHYLTLCIPLWACVGIDALHQRLKRRIARIRTRGNAAILRLNTPEARVVLNVDTVTPTRPTPHAHQSPPSSPVPAQTAPPQPPLLSIYLIGWGVAAILCGISAAVNVKELPTASGTGQQHTPNTIGCLLPVPLFPSAASLSVAGRNGITVTVWAPYVALGAVIAAMIILVRIRCGQLRWLLDGRHGLGRMSEGDGTQATEQVDLELLEPPMNSPSTPTSLSSAHARPQRWRTTTSCIATALNSSQRSDSDDTSTTTSNHHHNNSNSTQCCDPDAEWREVTKQAVHLLLVAGMVVCSGAVLMGGRWGGLIGGRRILFGVLYAVMAAVVAVFVVGVYCVGAVERSRSQWSQLFKRPSPHTTLFATSPPVTPQPPPATPQPEQPSSSVAVAIRPASSSNNSNTSNKPYTTLTAVPTGAADIALRQTLIDNQPAVKITNIEAAARGHQFVAGAMSNIIENCAQSAEMFYNPHQSFVARRFFRKQKQQRSMQKRNNMLIARQHQQQSLNTGDGDIFAGNSSKVNNTNIHTELLDNAGVGTGGRNRANRRRNLNMLCDNTEDDATTDKGRRRVDRDKERDRYRHVHKKRHNICRDNDPSLQLQSQQLNMMRTVSQQCTLKYSSDNITGEIDFDGAAAAVLDKSIDSTNPIEPTYCNVIELKKQFAAATANTIAISQHPDELEKDSKNPRIFLNPIHNLYSMDDHPSILLIPDQRQPPDLLLTLEHTPSPPHTTITPDKRQLPSPTLKPHDTPTAHDHPPPPTGTNTMAATVSCSSVCPSELDELYQQIRGVGVRVGGKSRSQVGLLADDRQRRSVSHRQHWQSDSEVNDGYRYDGYCSMGADRWRNKKERRGSLIILAITVAIIVFIVIAGVCAAVLLDNSTSKIVIYGLIGALILVGLTSFVFLELRRRDAQRKRDRGADEWIRETFRLQTEGRNNRSSGKTWAYSEALSQKTTIPKN